jgi:xanthine dehydrogenase accessory factor
MVWRFELMPTDLAILQEAIKLVASRKSIALCTITAKKGSTARDVGAKMIVDEDGKCFGTIGGGAVEHYIVKESIEAIGNGKSTLASFSLSERPITGAIVTGMICGGELSVLIDVISPTPRMIIFGTGNVALPLASLASTLGFEVVLVDEVQMRKIQLPTGTTTVTCKYVEIANSVKFTQHDYVVVAHGEPEHDYEALESSIRTRVTYVGLVGSKRKAAILIQRLKQNGVSDEVLKKLHSPVGLPIGAETPEEIGISILAEIIQIRKGEPPN